MSQHKISSIPHHGSKGLVIKRGDREVRVMVVLKDGKLYCYHNICPHTGANLDWSQDQFLNAKTDLIQCATHGALFRIEDGFCVSGPCAGQKLFPLELKIDGDMFEVILKK